jgi:hypothetical protein
MSSSIVRLPRFTTVEPNGPTQKPTQKKELSLELGLSVWMRRNDIAVDDCRAAMLAIRASLLEVAGMDAETEPVPLYGRSPEIDVANFAAYLADLFLRASAAVDCELPHVIGQVSEHLAS